VIENRKLTADNGPLERKRRKKKLRERRNERKKRKRIKERNKGRLRPGVQSPCASINHITYTFFPCGSTVLERPWPPHI
jgi:hypothetical protein